MPEGQIPSLNDTDVMDITAAYTAVGAQYGAYITGRKADPARQYVAVAYTIYEVDGNQYMLCSINDYQNQFGVKTAENGCCIKSVYDITVDMAVRLLGQENIALDWSRLGAEVTAEQIMSATEETVPSLQNVFLFVGSNRSLLQKITGMEE